jgi:putative spermidine/putrescine transport system substrate-binding protein
MKNIFRYLTSLVITLNVIIGYDINTSLAEDLTVVSFGGAYGNAQRKHMIDPFVEETGTNILFEEYFGGIAKLKTQVEVNKTRWDVVDMEVVDLKRACSEGLLEEIPREILPTSDDGVVAESDFIPAALASPCGVGVIVFSVIYAYDKSKMKGVPKTIADLFDTKKFSGKRAFKKRPQVNFEWALIADGVQPSRVYEILKTDEGQARALAKLDTIKDDIIWFDSWSQAPQLLNDDVAVMVQSANGRIFNAIKEEKKPFKVVWDNHLYDLGMWAVVKGTKKKDLAFKYIAHATQSKQLSGMADVAYSPTRKSSAKHIDPEVNPDLPTYHLDHGIKVNAEFWANYGKILGEKFNEWLFKKNEK